MDKKERRSSIPGYDATDGSIVSHADVSGSGARVVLRVLVAGRVVLCVPITQEPVNVVRVDVADIFDLDVVLSRVVNSEENS